MTTRAAGAADLRESLPAQLANCAAFWEGFGRVHEDPDGTRWFRSGVALGEVNGVRRGSPEDLTAAADRVGAALDGLPWTWWTTDDGVPSEAALHDLGLRTVERMPHLAVATDAVGVRAPLETDLRVQEVDDAQLDEFVALWAGNFGVPAEFAGPLAGLERARASSDEQCLRLAGWSGGRMVSTALLLTAHGIAGVYCVTTALELRGRGLGRTMTLAAIGAARDRGLGVAALQATPDGLPLYRSLGFEQLTSWAVLAEQGGPGR